MPPYRRLVQQLKLPDSENLSEVDRKLKIAEDYLTAARASLSLSADQRARWEVEVGERHESDPKLRLLFEASQEWGRPDVFADSLWAVLLMILEAVEISGQNPSQVVHEVLEDVGA